ncbi:MAG: efflux RND transporter periplasmic adaptor subunit [Bacteroidales bacterium]
MKKKKIIIGVLSAVILFIVLLIVFTSGQEETKNLKVEVEKGQFRINVTTTGELEAKKSEKIYGPRGLRNFRIWEIKIEDIIPDGTVVDSGDYVARLDKTELTNKLKDQEIDLEQSETQYTKTRLDTTLELREARDELINLKYNLEEKQIALDQSIYEPPATQRQAKIDLEKAQRSYERAVNNYIIKKERAEADMQEISAALREDQQEYDQIKELEKEFLITAPKSGMVIYRRSWDGQKQGIGATVSVWDPVVAELPDLTEMISKTYVNEIDISKVNTGQKVEIGVDAFPDMSYTGSVTEVANIGEQLRNSNAKVFEVIIEVNEYDSILRPSMTTKNVIITDIIDSVLYVPIECIHSNDSLTYVFTSGKKQQVIVGKSNENEIIVREGLKEGDEVYLLQPDNPEDYKLSSLAPGILKIYEEEENQKELKKQKMRDRQLQNLKGNTPPRGKGRIRTNKNRNPK